MNNNKLLKLDCTRHFFFNVAPTKLSEGRRLKLYTKGWGLLTEFFLESVKINCRKKGVRSSVATLKITDRSGQITCVVQGPQVGLLFGLSAEEWSEVESLCGYGEQLFYRQFKEGISKNFKYEQRLFYNFCVCRDNTDVFVAMFCRKVNMRNKDKNDAFLQILNLRKCDNSFLDLYIDHLTKINTVTEISV